MEEITIQDLHDCSKKLQERQKMYIASCSFGKDSIATILLALEHNEPLDRVVFSEVMFDHEKGISGEIPEHIEWIYNTAITKLGSMGVKVDVVRAKNDYVHLCKKILTKGKKKGEMYGVQNCFPCYANSELKIRPIRAYYSYLRKDYDIVQYVGITIDEPKRLARLEGTNKISLLAKYGYTEKWAMGICGRYGLISPIYSRVHRSGCFFCCNANIESYIHIRKNHPHLWDELTKLYYATNSKFFKYNKTLQEIEKQMDAYEWKEEHQLKLFK